MAQHRPEILGCLEVATAECAGGTLEINVATRYMLTEHLQRLSVLTYDHTPIISTCESFARK